MFVGKIVAVTASAETVSAETVDLGMVVSPGKGLFVEAGPAQLSRAKITTKYKSDCVCLSSEMKFFKEKVS